MSGDIILAQSCHPQDENGKTQTDYNASTYYPDCHKIDASLWSLLLFSYWLPIWCALYTHCRSTAFKKVLTQRMKIKWIKAIMIVVVTQLTLTTQYEISVCAFCESLDLNIQDVGGSSSNACDPDLCLKSGKMALFLRETRSMIGNSTLNIIEDDPCHC